MNLLVQGCYNCYEFKISFHNTVQYIYLFGEDHDFKGNAIDIIDFFINNTNCPIHVLNEEDRSFKNPNRDYCLTDNSNVLLIHKKYGKCANLKLKTPKDNDIKNHLNYIKECILPLKGRVKFWNMDLRNSSFFSFFKINDKFLDKLIKYLDISFMDKRILTECSIDNFNYNVKMLKIKYASDIDRTKFDQIILKMVEFINIYKLIIKYLFDFQLYNTSIINYHLNLYDILTRENIPLHLLKLYFSRIYLLLNKIKKTKGHLKFTIHERYKNHLYLMNSLNYLVHDTLNQIFKIFEYYYSFNELKTNNLFVDIYTILRIIRLVRENKSQYILGFFGNDHAHLLSILLSIPSIFQYKTEDKNHYKMKGKVYPFDINDPNRTIKIRKINNCKKSERMLLYQDLIKKKKFLLK